MTPVEAEPTRIVILISGSGSNMQTIAAAIQKQEIEAEICAIISNRPEALGLQKAKDMGIHTQILDHTQAKSREEYDADLIHAIEEYNPDLVVLAGFMRILTPAFVHRYKGRLLNIHPSLLPKYKGLHTHKRALEAGDKQHGCSVHFVSEDLDGGPTIIQAIVPVMDDDNESTLQQRVMKQEHIIYPIAVKWFCEGRLNLIKGDAYLDNKDLPDTGLQLTPES